MPAKKRKGRKPTKKKETEVSQPNDEIVEQLPQAETADQEDSGAPQTETADQLKPKPATKAKPGSKRKNSNKAAQLQRDELSDLKSYPKSLKLAVADKTPLYVNRRGIVPPQCDSDKPLLTSSELIQQRRLGLSYKQIGRKLGIDPHKGDVLQVYHALDIDPETIEGPSKVVPPTPLWYLFNSEKEVIGEYLLPTPSQFLQMFPQTRVVERLGDNAGFMLSMYLEVSSIISEEIARTLSCASPGSQVGRFVKWNGGLPGEILHRASRIEMEIGTAAFQATDCWNEKVGNCVCSGVKVLRFGWRTDPIPHPSFFWGCSKYTPLEVGKHDKGVPVRDSLFDVINCDFKVSRCSDKDLRSLSEKLMAAGLSFWDKTITDEELGEPLSKQVKAIYGGPSDFCQKEDVIDTVSNIIAEIQGLIQDREETSEHMNNKLKRSKKTSADNHDTASQEK